MPRVRLADISEIRQVSIALTDAFDGEAVAEWISPHHFGRRSRRHLMFALDLRVQLFPNHGFVTTADVAHGGLVGACLSLPPGGWEMPKSLDGRTTLKFLCAYGGKLSRVIRMQRAMAQRHPTEDHYYFRWIGVRPGLRGQGWGKALMQPTLERCDAEGLPSYLEASSDRSAILYERLGFVRRGVLQLPDGGPQVWPMWRPPKP